MPLLDSSRDESSESLHILTYERIIKDEYSSLEQSRTD